MGQKINSLRRFFLSAFVLLFLFSNSLLAYSFTWDPGTGTLTINADNLLGEDIIFCRCAGGDVTVNGNWLKDADNNDVHIAAASVTKLIINGGIGPDLINLTCVDQTTYPNLAKTGDEFRVQINSGEGNDEIYGSGHSTEVNAGGGHDYVETYEGDDKINAGDGDDEVWGGAGNDEINGEGGYDELDGEEGNDTINGGDGDDDCYGGDGDDIINGGDGNDKLRGDFESSNGDGADEIYGGAGNDEFDLDFDDTVCDGGTGNDRAFTPLNLFLNDMSNTPKLLAITDQDGVDDLDFSLSTRALKINMDLGGISQAINNFGYNLRLEGQFENVTGTPQDDEITLKALPGITRNIVCGLQLNKDVLNFDCEQKIVINTGYSLTCEGNDLVLYTGLEEVNLLNLLTDVDENPELPMKFELNQNYPNPFNLETTIIYSLPEQVNVNLKIYDSLGKEIYELVNEEQHAGYHNINFNAADISSGVYYYKINAGNYSEAKTMMLLK